MDNRTSFSAHAAVILAAGLFLGVQQRSSADEGMWLVNKPPLAVLRERHNYDPSAALLEHLRLCAINFGGASGSFVSSRGLVMTNHHVAQGAISDLSTPERDITSMGFLARSHDQELRCPNLTLRVLLSIEDVTDRVNMAVKPGSEPAAADAARRAAIVEIEKQAKEAMLAPKVISKDTKDGKETKDAKEGAAPAGEPALAPDAVECTVVALYSGGRYHLYTSRRFTDVRLVFAPEQAIANFGGDTLNFEYPRFDLDLCLLRVYENDKPYQPKHFLRFAPRGAKAGDLAVVFGHPGRTQRLLTIDDLKFRRDIDLPQRLATLWREEQKLTAFCNRSLDNRRMAIDVLLGVANGRKARTGMLAGLLDPELMAAKQADEARLRAAVEANPDSKAKWGGAWDAIAAATKNRRAWHERYSLVGTPRLGTIFGHALALLRLSEELKKPAGERLAEYRDSRLPAVYQNLTSKAPIHDALEVETLSNGLTYLAERFGGEDPLVVSLLGGKSPRARAEELIAATSLKAPASRKQALELAKAIAAAGGPTEKPADKPGEKPSETPPANAPKLADPMIEFARLLDSESRTLLAKYRDEVEAVERDAYAKLAQARFAIDGEKTYPDATGTLRMSFGPIKGYSEGGTEIAPFTTFEGLFKMADSRAADGNPGTFQLPKRWLDARKNLDLSTPFNFVCTADIIGGNSGSPVVNEAGDITGLIFDGNIQSLPGAFQYSEAQARAVSVDSRGILEALRKVYDADGLAKELEGK